MKKQINNFNIGMRPSRNDDGLYRIEHFDTRLGSLKPYQKVVYSVDDSDTYDAIHKIIKVGGVTGATSLSNLFGLARNFGGARFAILEWDITQQKWSDFKASGADSTYAYGFHYYDGKFIGLTNGSHLWTITKAAVNLAAVALDYTDTDPQFITHTKDDLCYIAVDNKVYSYNGTTVTLGITLPSNFLITSIAERGDYIMIVGYDDTLEDSYAYLWDRDSSLETLTAKYEIGNYQAVHNATLEGIDFVVSASWESSNTTFADQRSLIIGHLIEDKYKIVNKYIFHSITIGGKYAQGDTLYFLASARFVGESAIHSLVFRLDSKGRLFIEQNLGLNDTNNYTLNTLIKDGDGFFTGIINSDSVASCGIHSTDGYDTASIIETTRYKAKKKQHNLDFVGCVVETEPFPSGGQLLIKTRADEETTWTTIGTFTTENDVKVSFVNNGTIATAKSRQFRIESTGGVEITGYQFDLEEINNEQYG